MDPSSGESMIKMDRFFMAGNSLKRSTIDQLILAGPPNTFFGFLDQSAPNPEPG